MSKHPTVPGADLATVRSLFLKFERRNSRSLLATAIEHLKLPAQEADTFLRKLAMAGYLEWNSKYGQSLDWDLTEYGLRLVADGLGPRLSSEKVRAIIDEVVKRARAINNDPHRLARVRDLKLFGSALDLDREDYGDVDIEAEIEIRRLPKKEVAQAHAEIAAKIPLAWRDHLVLRHNAEENYDCRSVFGALKKGISGLSLSKDATKRLGCEFRRIYRFDVPSGCEGSPDEAITPRTTPAPKAANEIQPAVLPANTVIQPAGLAGVDEKIRSEKLRVSMQELAVTEARVWLGEKRADGSRTATNTRRNPPQRFVGAQFLFDEWRDPNLTGLELFQRSLDWASLYELPISKIGRKFTLRTYRNTRVANFNALVVQRVADRVDADLVLDKRKGMNGHSYDLGRSAFTTPKMIAAHHALAVALGRMIDETRLTGQSTFTAEFDLTTEKRNFYPPLPDLSSLFNRLKNSLSKVTFPEAMIEEARRRKESYETDLPLSREIEVVAAVVGKKRKELVGFACGKFGADWDLEMLAETEGPTEFFAGEDHVWELADTASDELKDRLVELPGCQRLSLRHKAPVSDSTLRRPL